MRNETESNIFARLHSTRQSAEELNTIAERLADSHGYEELLDLSEDIRLQLTRMHDDVLDLIGVIAERRDQ